MRIFRQIESVGPALRGSAVAIGNFDGVHRGHQALLELARERAAARGARAVALTFEPHPAKVLSPDSAPRLLTTPARKLERLRTAGMDAVVVQRFDRDFARNSAEEFVERFLVAGLGAADVVVGWDFTFGRGRAGNPEVLAHLARGSFQVHTVQPVRQAGEVVSSTRIRQLLGEGQVEAAAELLGEPFVLDGSIVRGKGRGTGIGFPTANLAPETEIVPADGVYTVLCAVEGIEGVLGGAASVGTNPTFGEGERTIEVHLFGEFGHLYGRRIAVAFLHRIREERRFATVQELVERIGEDVRIARTQVAGWSGPAPVLVLASNF